jgi:hypothetical protein
MPAWFSNVADGIGILAALFAFLGWVQTRRLRADLEKEKLRQLRKIRVELANGGRKIPVPVEFKRSEFTRAEIQGRLGVIPMKKKGARYSIEFLNTPEFLRRIEEISNDEGDSVLTIPCNDVEIEQFDIKIK